MAIVKKKNPSTGGVYYYNTTTSKFASEAAFKRSKGGIGKIDAKFQARSGKPSKAVCQATSKELRIQKTSAAGRRLRSCGN